MEKYMKSFKYDDQEMSIIITDETFEVTWANVDDNVAKEASKMYGMTKEIDTFLGQKGCKRIWR